MSKKRIFKKSVLCNFEGCSKSFTCQSKLNDHLNAHLNERPFLCEICNKSYCSKKALSVHKSVYEHFSTNSCCEMNSSEIQSCEMNTSEINTINTHSIKNKSLNSKTIYSCNKCLKIYSHKSSFKKHSCLKQILKCDRCSKVYERRKLFDKHMLKCSKIRLKKCSKNSISYKNFVKNSFLKKYSCEICKMQFLTKHAASRHRKIEHEGLRYVCEICGREFRHNCSLKKHKLKEHIN